MREEQNEFFEIMNSFRKLNISSMLPEISHGDFCVLKTINDCSRCSENREGKVKVSDIAKAAMLPPPTVSRSLRGLEIKELVARTVDQDDRRNTFVEITPKGGALLKEIEAIMNSFAEAVFGNLGEETMGKLNRYLGKLVEVSKAEIEKRRYQERKGEIE